MGIIALLASAMMCCVAKAKSHACKVRQRIEMEHYQKLLPYIDEKPFMVVDRVAYYTNSAFPGVLFSVTTEGSERPSM